MPGRGGTEQPQRADAVRASAALPARTADRAGAGRSGGASGYGEASGYGGRPGYDGPPGAGVVARPASGGEPTRVGGAVVLGEAVGIAGVRGRPDPGAAALLEQLGDPAQREVHLTSRPESAYLARRLALAVAWRWGLGQHADTVELLVSELVGNAVRHTGARTVGLRMLRGRARIRTEVRDPSRALPCLLPIKPLDIGGRGLFLVNHYADRWGADLHPRGKTTWFELRAPER